MTATEPPSRVRIGVLLLLCAMTFILYLDRVCMGQAVVPIQKELGLSDTRMGFILAAFTAGYVLFQIPMGRLGDRRGARWLLTRVVTWWSIFTALTAACGGFVSLVLVRFLFGAGEAGAYPNTARVLARWFPDAERGRAQGWTLTSSLIGAAVVPALASALIVRVGWRAIFVVFGTLGIFWTAAFGAWYRDDPARHPRVNAAERDLIGAGAAGATAAGAPIPWWLVLRDGNIWLLGLVTSCSAFSSYFFYSWYPKYLQVARGTGLMEAGWLASVVTAGAAVGTLLGGYVLDWGSRPGHGAALAWRRRIGSVGCACAALLLAGSVAVDAAWASAAMCALGCLAMTTQMSSWWSAAIEVSGAHIGALMGFMNGLGFFGAVTSQIFFGGFADWQASRNVLGRAQWDPALLVTAGLLLVAACGWRFVGRAPRRSPSGGPRP